MAGALFEQLIARNGRPLSAGQRRREREAREAFRRAAEEAAARGELVETDDERQVRFNRELVERYRTALAGETMIDGAPCWIIAFEPRDGPIPERTRLDRVMNKSKGRYYVRQQDAAVRRIEFELQRPMFYLWGLLAKLQSASGRLDFEQAAPSVWFPQVNRHPHRAPHLLPHHAPPHPAAVDRTDARRGVLTHRRGSTVP